MTTYHFTFTLAGIRELSDDEINALYEAGCDDATFSWSGGRVTADFSRVTESKEMARFSAIQQIESVLPNVEVVGFC
jgi:hypothetical protein